MLTMVREMVGRLGGADKYARLRSYRRDWANRRYAANQTTIQLRVGDYVLDAPSTHMLARLQAKQPYRDLEVGIAARELARKYPGETLVDIGANIGDTAAIMATYSPSPKILVEPSDIYLGYLLKNVERIPNIMQVHQVFVSGREREQGILVHDAGTARFETIAGSGKWVDCKPLAEIADGNTRLIKIDTDGFDMPILASSLDFLARRRPCLVYEVTVTDAEKQAAADRLLVDLVGIGYKYFAVFDDAGLHLVSTTDLGVLRHLNHYLFKASTGTEGRELYDYNMLCLPVEDEDVFALVTEYYQQS